jgi:hypothetical protein
MTGREMLVGFEELIRTTNPDLEFDVTINTDLVYSILSRAQQEYVTQHFLMGDNIVDNINAVRKHSDILRKLIRRTNTAIMAADSPAYYVASGDGGYSAVFGTSNVALDDYWMFLSGNMYSSFLVDSAIISPARGANNGIVELDLINHYDLQKKIRTINNEPVFKYIPIVLENVSRTLSGNTTNYDGFVFYLDREKETALSGHLENATFNIIYLSFPDDIDSSTTEALQSLPPSTHNDIIKLAVDIFLKEYKYLLGSINKNTNG